VREINKEWTYLKKRRSISSHSTVTTCHNLFTGRSLVARMNVKKNVFKIQLRNFRSKKAT